MNHLQTLDREQASLLNPIIGTSMADTVSNVAVIMRAITLSENIDKVLVNSIAWSVEGAMAFEENASSHAE